MITFSWKLFGGSLVVAKKKVPKCNKNVESNNLNRVKNSKVCQTLKATETLKFMK